MAPPGSFQPEEDQRHTLTKEGYNTSTKTNSSYTYTYSDLRCKACPSRHPILGRDVKPVFILSDQHFPAAVPVCDGGKCLAIFRIEDASLLELTETFLEKISTGWLPPGTTVLLSAVGYLAGIGTAAYAEEFSDMAERIKHTLPNSAHVYHGPLLLLEGSEDPALIRSISEIGHWLLASADRDSADCLPETTEAWLGALQQADSGNVQPTYPIRLELPGSATNSQHKKRIWHSEPRAALSANSLPLTTAVE